MDYFVENMLSVLFVSDQDQESDGLIGQRDVCRIQTFHEHHLPAIKTLLAYLDYLMQTAYSEVFHVVVSNVKELVKNLGRLLDQVRVGVDIAHCLYCLLQNAFAEMKS